jgi:RNA polymerase sigma-70 factor, ECF subfamily
MDEQNRDEWLMAEVARGKRESLEPLMRRHATSLLTFLERMTGDRHRSEELFQEVFLAIWKNRRRYEHPRPFRPWLYAIALNQGRAAFRRATVPTLSLDAHVNAGAISLPPDDESSPVETAIATETAALVNAAVAVLPPQQRAAIVLRVWQQLSYAEIAAILETTETTARSHMHHGLCALRKYLEPRLT